MIGNFDHWTASPWPDKGDFASYKESEQGFERRAVGREVFDLEFGITKIIADRVEKIWNTFPLLDGERENMLRACEELVLLGDSLDSALWPEMTVLHKDYDRVMTFLKRLEKKYEKK